MALDNTQGLGNQNVNEVHKQLSTLKQDVRIIQVCPVVMFAAMREVTRGCVYLTGSFDHKRIVYFFLNDDAWMLRT